MIHVFLCHHMYNVSTDTTIAQGKTNEARSNSIPQLACNKIANGADCQRYVITLSTNCL